MSRCPLCVEVASWMDTWVKTLSELEAILGADFDGEALARA